MDDSPDATTIGKQLTAKFLEMGLMTHTNRPTEPRTRGGVHFCIGRSTLSRSAATLTMGLGHGHTRCVRKSAPPFASRTLARSEAEEGSCRDKR